MNIEERFESLSIETIDQYLADGQEEHLHLDFKRIPKPEMTRDDRKHLAMAISGFANSDGGLIVWGVDTRKAPNRDGADCACDKKEIPSLTLFLSKLNEFTGQAVNPVPDGVRHRKIDIGEDKGFAVTLVPGSDAGPHMAKLGEDRYYKRSGDSFLKMEHFDIADMFGRRRKPVPKLCYRLDIPFIAGRAPHSSYHVKITLGIENYGRAAARDLFLSLRLPSGYGVDEYGVDGNRNFGLRRLPHSHGSQAENFSASGDVVLHPGMQHDVMIISTNIPTIGPNPMVTIPYAIAAEDFPLTEESLTITEDAFVAKFREMSARG